MGIFITGKSCSACNGTGERESLGRGRCMFCKGTGKSKFEENNDYSDPVPNEKLKFSHEEIAKLLRPNSIDIKNSGIRELKYQSDELIRKLNELAPKREERLSKNEMKMLKKVNEQIREILKLLSNNKKLIRIKTEEEVLQKEECVRRLCYFISSTADRIGINISTSYWKIPELDYW